MCYIVQAFVQCTTFAVNYVGHPFNTSIKENRGLYNGLWYMTVFLFVVTFDLVPGLNENFGLVALPRHIQIHLVLLASIVYNLSYALEVGLRKWVPARMPPLKGYMAHADEIARLQNGAALSKKHN